MSTGKCANCKTLPKFCKRGVAVPKALKILALLKFFTFECNYWRHCCLYLHQACISRSPPAPASLPREIITRIPFLPQQWPHAQTGTKLGPSKELKEKKQFRSIKCTQLKLKFRKSKRLATLNLPSFTPLRIRQVNQWKLSALTPTIRGEVFFKVVSANQCDHVRDEWLSVAVPTLQWDQFNNCKSIYS